MREPVTSAEAAARVPTPTTTGAPLGDLYLTAHAAQAKGLSRGYTITVATFQLADGRKVVVDLEYGHATIGGASLPRLRRSNERF
jgi:hypothetical protein